MRLTPLASPVAHVKGIDALVNQPQAVSTTDNLLELLSNFRFVVAREDTNDASHGPCEQVRHQFLE